MLLVAGVGVATLVDITRSCSYGALFPMMGDRPKHVQIIIVNKSK